MSARLRQRRNGTLGPARATTEDLLDLVGGIYEAGADHGRWPGVLQGVMRVMGNSGCHLLLSDQHTGRIRRSVHLNMPDEMIREYNAEVIQVCPRVEHGRAHPERDMFWDYQHIDDRGINRNGFYDWLQRRGDGIRYYLAALLYPKIRRDVSLNYLSLAFRRREGHATRAQIRLFARIVPHITRALEVGQRLGTGALAHAASLEFLDALPDAVVLLDDQARVLAANRAALALARQGDFVLDLKGLRLTSRRLDATLQSLLAGARDTAAGQGMAGGGVIRLDGTPERILSVVPLGAGAQEPTLARARVAVFVRQTLAPVAPATEDLQMAFGLTAAEARLARALASGMNPAAAAKQAGVSIHTARAQLKQVLGKTRTQRQADLVRVLLGAGVRRLPDGAELPTRP